MAIHVVAAGDTLWRISQTYRVPLQTIMTVNGLLPENVIVPGLALYIPTSEITYRYYSISAGDTLYAISRRFNTNVTAIVTANPGINPNFLAIGQKIIIPSPIKMNMETLGFAVPYSASALLPKIRQLADQLTYLAVVSYSMTAEGWAYVLLEDRQIIAESKRVGIKPLLMIRNIQNEQFNPELIGQVLENPLYRSNLIRSLMNFIRQRGYVGVSLDFEFIPPARRNDFTIFLRELKQALGNLILHVNVHAKTVDAPTNRIIGAYDYRAIGEIADIVAIMTIDYGYPTGPPNPISPLWWMEQVIQYAIGLIPSNKIQVSIPLYAYDWRTIDNNTTSLSVLAAQNFALQNRISIQFDPIAAVPWYEYWIGAEQHVVWFGDIRSVTEKYKLVDYYRLRGSTYWHIGLDFPQNWAFIKDSFRVLK
jgi:spore germination protein